VNVLHVDSAADWRGGQNQVLLTAKGMAARGHRVTLACRSGGALEARAREQGLDVQGLPLRGDLSLRASGGLVRLLRHTRPDVLQLHDPHALAAGLLAAHAAPSVRILATRRVDFPLRGGLSRWKYRACRGVIAVSRKIADVLGQDGVPRERIRVVYEGVPDRPALPGGREALLELGVPEGCPVVGNVAALTDHKDHATLIEAAARVRQRLPDARFVCVGEGELRPRLEALCRERGPARPMDLRRVPPRLDRADPRLQRLLLSSAHGGPGHQPARCDGLPAAPWWPRAAGGIPEAVDDGVTGRLVPVRDAAGAAGGPGREPRRSGARPGHGRGGTAPASRSWFTADRMVDETLSALRRPGVKVPRHPSIPTQAWPRARADGRHASGRGPLDGVRSAAHQGPGDARRLAREAADAGFDAVLSVGGDGTANEAAWGLLHSPTALGLIPAGSGNGLARSLRIPLRPAAALRALQDAVVRRMDVGTVQRTPLPERGGRRLRRAGGRRFPRVGTRRRPARAVQLLPPGAAPRARLPGQQLEPGGGDRALRGPAFLVAFLNGRQYGGAAVMSPGSRLDDGLLEIVVVEDAPAFELLVNAPRLFLGGIERFRRYRRIAASRAVLIGPAAFEHHRDGEPEPPCAHLDVAVDPRALAGARPADDRRRPERALRRGRIGIGQGQKKRES
jgi:diacylglycerol kinase family enzyme